MRECIEEHPPSRRRTQRRPWAGAGVLAAALLWSAAATAQVTVPAGGSVSVPPGGAVDLACTGLLVNGSFQLGSGQVDNAAGVTINAGGNVDGGTGTLNVSGDWSNGGSFVPGTGTVAFGDACTSGPVSFTGPTTFHNLTLDGGRTYTVPAGATLVVTGVLRLDGTLADPVTLVSSDPGRTAFIRLGPQAQVVRTFADVASNVQIGPATPTSIPTLEPVALVALSALLGAGAWWRRRRAGTAQTPNIHRA